jgi:diguanylate cyclase (GGDEF)-like protein
MISKQFSKNLALNIVLALIYFAAGKIGLMLAFINPSTTAIWPPAGIALATFLIAGNKAWPGILLGAFLVNETTSGSIPASTMIAIGNTLEGLIGAYLINRFANGRQVFNRGGDIFKFVILAGLFSTTVSATFGVTTLVLNGLATLGDYTDVWLTWWLGDAGGILTVTPFIILWTLNPDSRWHRGRIVEVVFLLLSVIFLSLIVFSNSSPFGNKDYSLEFLLMPAVIWAALRFGQREAATSTLIVAMIAIWGTLHGAGPFSRVAPNQALLLLQAFMNTMTIMGIGLAAAVSERQQMHASVREANEKLVQGLNELERRNQEMAILNETSDLLQSCLTVEEAYTLITQSVPQLFPGRAGALYVLSSSQNLVEATAVWGDHPPVQRVFVPDDCWALRRGRMHLVVPSSTNMLCSHLSHQPPRASLCLPMIAQGEILGVLHLQSMVMDGFPEGQLRLAQALADSLALALANLLLRESLRQQSIRDPLTGLYNRRYLEEALERELLRATRNQTQVGVIMLDIDHFKQFNDTLGHATGDLLLRELGIFLRRYIRGGDIACRYGGEEFLLLLPDTSMETLQERAEQMREEVKKLRAPDRGELWQSVSISLGVAIFPQHGLTGEMLLRVADGALYRAKSNGRDQVVIAETD